jgi:hypothetical protein
MVWFENGDGGCRRDCCQRCQALVKGVKLLKELSQRCQALVKGVKLLTVSS